MNLVHIMFVIMYVYIYTRMKIFVLVYTRTYFLVFKKLKKKYKFVFACRPVTIRDYYYSSTIRIIAASVYHRLFSTSSIRKVVFELKISISTRSICMYIFII